MNYRILYEDPEILALCKPAGVASVDHARGKPSPLVAWLRENFPETAALGEGPRPAGQVHRLDTETSGVLVIARTAEAYSQLRQVFGDTGGAGKIYEALLWGDVPQPLFCKWPIGARYRSSSKVVVARTGQEAAKLRGVRPAETRIVPLRHASQASWAKITITTGMRHQIRAHSAALGHPVVGDSLYGKREAKIPAKCEQRLYLHAAEVRLPPVEGRPEVTIRAPVPPCFEECFEALSSVRG